MTNNIIEQIEELDDFALRDLVKTMQTQLHPLTLKKINFDEAMSVDLEKELKQSQRSCELRWEQVYFAQTLIENIEIFVNNLFHERKLSKKALNQFGELLENTSFER